jgi:hypothetical protein
MSETFGQRDVEVTHFVDASRGDPDISRIIAANRNGSRVGIRKANQLHGLSR